MAEAAAMSAAEKRAARRARVLQGGESRLKLVTGQISSLKAEEDAAERQLERQMDEQAAELLADAGVSADLKVPTRVDPAQRRRDAAARRRKKEEAVQELLGGKKLVEEQEKPQEEEEEDVEIKPPTPVAAQGDKSDKLSGFSRHYLALQLQVAQDKAVALLILLAAVYIAMTVDLRAIIADLRLDDELLRSYQDLLARGIPIESIKQRLEREHLDHDEQVRIEQFLFTQQRSAALANDVSSADGLIPSFWDVSAFLETLVAHPPIIVGVFLLRVLLAAVAGAAHSILKLPDVKKPQEDDLGFVMNLALSSRPALKGYVVKLRKSADDLFLFLFVLVVTIAVRALWFA